MSCGGGSGTNTVVQNSSPPQQALNAYSDVISRAQGAANQPLQQYAGPMLAGFTPDQIQAMNEVRGAQGIAQPYINAAAGLTSAGAAPITPTQFSGDAISQYLNPYTQDVVNSTQAQFNNQNAQQQQQLTGNAISKGAWGGDRAGVAQGILAGQQQLAQAPVIAGLNNQNYSSALQEFNAQQQADMQAQQASGWLAENAGFGMAGLGSQALNTTLGAASPLLQSGALQQGLAQQAINIPYEQFIQQQAYPFQTTSWLGGIAEGAGGAMGGTSGTSYPAPSALGTVAGLGMTGLGLYGLGNSAGLFGASQAAAPAAASAVSGSSFDSNSLLNYGDYFAARGGRITKDSGGSAIGSFGLPDNMPDIPDPSRPRFDIPAGGSGGAVGHAMGIPGAPPPQANEDFMGEGRNALQMAGSISDILKNSKRTGAAFGGAMMPFGASSYGSTSFGNMQRKHYDDGGAISPYIVGYTPGPHGISVPTLGTPPFDPGAAGGGTSPQLPPNSSGSIAPTSYYSPPTADQIAAMGRMVPGTSTAPSSPALQSATGLNSQQLGSAFDVITGANGAAAAAAGGLNSLGGTGAGSGSGAPGIVSGASGSGGMGSASQVNTDSGPIDIPGTGGGWVPTYTSMGAPSGTGLAASMLPAPISTILGAVNMAGSAINTVANSNMLRDMGITPTALQQLGGALGMNGMAGSTAQALNQMMQNQSTRSQVNANDTSTPNAIESPPQPDFSGTFNVGGQQYTLQQLQSKWDDSAYLAANPDVAAAFGPNSGAPPEWSQTWGPPGLTQYIRSGASEGRAPTLLPAGSPDSSSWTAPKYDQDQLDIARESDLGYGSANPDTGVYTPNPSPDFPSNYTPPPDGGFIPPPPDAGVTIGPIEVVGEGGGGDEGAAVEPPPPVIEPPAAASAAASAGGGGGCYITTAAVDHMGLKDDGPELSTLRRFRDDVLSKTPEGRRLIHEYQTVAPTIVDAINGHHDPKGVYTHLYKEYIAPAVLAAQGGDHRRATELYGSMVRHLETAIPAASRRPHKDIGGSIGSAGAATTGMTGGTPQDQQQAQKYAGMSEEQLQELVVRLPSASPQGMAARRALMAKRMAPAAGGSGAASLASGAMAPSMQANPSLAGLWRGGTADFADGGTPDDAGGGGDDSDAQWRRDQKDARQQRHAEAITAFDQQQNNAAVTPPAADAPYVPGNPDSVPTAAIPAPPNRPSVVTRPQTPWAERPGVSHVIGAWNALTAPNTGKGTGRRPAARPSDQPTTVVLTPDQAVQTSGEPITEFKPTEEMRERTDMGTEPRRVEEESALVNRQPPTVATPPAAAMTAPPAAEVPQPPMARPVPADPAAAPAAGAITPPPPSPARPSVPAEAAAAAPPPAAMSSPLDFSAPRPHAAAPAREQTTMDKIANSGYLPILMAGAGMLSSKSPYFSQRLGAGVSEGVRTLSGQVAGQREERKQAAAEQHQSADLDLRANQLSELASYHRGEIQRQSARDLADAEFRKDTSRHQKTTEDIEREKLRRGYWEPAGPVIGEDGKQKIGEDGQPVWNWINRYSSGKIETSVGPSYDVTKTAGAATLQARTKLAPTLFPSDPQAQADFIAGRKMPTTTDIAQKAANQAAKEYENAARNNTLTPEQKKLGQTGWVNQRTSEYVGQWTPHAMAPTTEAAAAAPSAAAGPKFEEGAIVRQGDNLFRITDGKPVYQGPAQ